MVPARTPAGQLVVHTERARAGGQPEDRLGLATHQPLDGVGRQGGGLAGARADDDLHQRSPRRRPCPRAADPSQLSGAETWSRPSSPAPTTSGVVTTRVKAFGAEDASSSSMPSRSIRCPAVSTPPPSTTGVGWSSSSSRVSAATARAATSAAWRRTTSVAMRSPRGGDLEQQRGHLHAAFVRQVTEMHGLDQRQHRGEPEVGRQGVRQRRVRTASVRGTGRPPHRLGPEEPASAPVAGDVPDGREAHLAAVAPTPGAVDPAPQITATPCGSSSPARSSA